MCALVYLCLGGPCKLHQASHTLVANAILHRERVRYKTVLFSDPDHGDVERSYIQYVPSNYDGQTGVPLLLDFHGWTSSAQSQMETESQFHLLAEALGFVAVFVQGTDDSPSGVTSWNIAREVGPYGDVCDRDRDYWGVYECHYSCPGCDPHTTCKAGYTCYNDLAFVEHLVRNILLEELNIDQSRIHASGFSNGGQFTYYLASFSTLPLASVGVVSGSPFLGFGPVRDPMVPIIDMHGSQDSTIPFGLTNGYGRGPEGIVETIKSSDGIYYYDKEQYRTHIADTWGCDNPEPFPTAMDGVDDFQCVARRCPGGRVVSCGGQYGHMYPFSWGDATGLEASKILWRFMEEEANKK